jgi:hypothetical protein
MRLTCLISLFCLASISIGASAAQIPLRADWPDATLSEAIPLSGGIPFPEGAVKSTDNIRLLSAGKEIPTQVSKLAVWPDASIKWAMVDVVVAPKDVQELTLEYGPEVQRAAVADPLNATLDGADAKISGGGVTAAVKKTGGGVIDELTLNGKQILSADKPARLHVDTLRIPDGTSGTAFPTASFVCRDSNATPDIGNVAIDTVSIESPGPIRATVLIRGHMLLQHFGATLPDEVKQREPAGRMPFSMRVSFYKGTSIVYGQHQIIFSGEPDCDFITHWGVELPGCAGPHGTLVLEPGVTLEQTGETQKVQENPSRICWAPIKGGLGLIREGWQNRPSAITQQNGSAWIEFWPAAAGAWDLRRYAREWAVGESGQGSDGDFQRFTKYAARGIAKSHNFVLDFNADGGKAPGLAKALSGRALLVASPAWYCSTQVLGPLAPEQTSGDFAGIDASARRHLDWYLFNQDLFGWYGKLTYGFFQTRFGEIHRNDRWDNDYGRWGWALNDGAGRFGHLLMLEFLRTLDRRYFDAGEAFNRINYDTNMVHTQLHLENCHNWWTAIGCCHRHNAQPFGCPYIGMRGSYPVGHRILYLLTGDGVIADGLDIVADSSFAYANGGDSRLCNSGGSDGQGSASNALLWKYETTGEKKYLDACRSILDKSGLVPPKDGKSLGYGPSFGLFNAAGEYAAISNDASFKDRVVATAKLGAKEKDPSSFVSVIAMGYHFSKDEDLKKVLTETLKKSVAKAESLADLPTKDWPGHGGFRTPDFNPNFMRDAATAIGSLTAETSPAGFPKPTPCAMPIPAAAPADWYKTGGTQTSVEHMEPFLDILNISSNDGELKVGDVQWKFTNGNGGFANSIESGDTKFLSTSVTPFVRFTDSKNATTNSSINGTAVLDSKIEMTGIGGSAQFQFHLKPSQVDGIPSMHVQAACKLPKGNGRIANWGLMIPLKLSAKGTEITTTAPGHFRLERCRKDQNDEKVPTWLTAMEGREKMPTWPIWRMAGIDVGPGKNYRIWHSSREDVSPFYVDQGEGTSNWFDVTDRGGEKKWGVTVRLLRADPSDTSRQAIRVNLETGVLLVEFHNEAAEPLSEEAAAAGLSGGCDVIFHDGWRPPLSKPELSPAQYEKFIDDCNISGSWGLNALRFALSDTHEVTGRKWPERLRDLGIEPREIMYGMQRGGILANLCQKLGVKWDANDVEGSIQRVIEHYRK